jgi:sulfide:quinone oxidoreductase
LNATEAANRRVTIVGGGIAALELTLALRDLAGDVAIELLTPEAEADYRPLAVLEPFALGEMPSMSIARFAEEQRAVLHRDTLVSVDLEGSSLTTGSGERRPFDLLVVAAGARPVEAVTGSLTFRGHGDQRRLGLLFEDYAAEALTRLVFAVPAAGAWTLPAYELALMSRASLAERGVGGIELAVVTPEEAPLEMFGPEASEAVAGLLDQADIELHTGLTPRRLEHGVLEVAGGEDQRADRVVALPRLLGPRLRGLPSDDDGFIPTDDHGLVEGLANVYAAGDVTAYPVKQGGLATQQADAVAEAIAARVGADIEPAPYRPVLRGLLMTGATARYLESGEGDSAGASAALWSPQSKVVGRYLLPYLGGREPDEDLLVDPPEHSGVPVEVDLAGPPHD